MDFNLKSTGYYVVKQSGKFLLNDKNYPIFVDVTFPFHKGNTPNIAIADDELEGILYTHYMLAKQTPDKVDIFRAFFNKNNTLVIEKQPVRKSQWK